MNVVLFRSLSDMLYVAREILSTMHLDFFGVFLPQLMAIVCVIAYLYLLTKMTYSCTITHFQIYGLAALIFPI